MVFFKNVKTTEEREVTLQFTVNGEGTLINVHSIDALNYDECIEKVRIPSSYIDEESGREYSIRAIGRKVFKGYGLFKCRPSYTLGIYGYGHNIKTLDIADFISNIDKNAFVDTDIDLVIWPFFCDVENPSDYFCYCTEIERGSFRDDEFEAELEQREAYREAKLALRNSINKRINHVLFKKLLGMYDRGDISKIDFAKKIGCSMPTLNKFISVYKYYGEIPTESLN